MAAPITQTQNKRARQDALIEWMGANKTSRLGEGLRALSIPEPTYDAWRRRDPQFVQRFEGMWTLTRGRRRSEVGPHRAKDFIKFRESYFKRKTFPHQLEMVKRLENAPPMSVTLILCPPEAGKSTLLTDWVSFRLGVDPNFRITYASQGQKLARKMLGRISRRMTDINMSEGVRRYITDYGPFHVPDRNGPLKPWTADYFTVAQADHDEADFSFEAIGWGGQIYGARADLIVLDDIQTIKTLNQTDAMLDWFRQDVVTRPGRSGHIVVIGTRVGLRDIYEKLIDEGIVDVGCLVMISALGVDGESYCEEMWPAKDLVNRKQKVAKKAWATAYMQRPEAAGDATFTEDMVNEADDDMLVSRPVEGMAHVMMLDPALGGGNALAVAAYDATRFRVVDLQIDYGLARVEDILDRIEQFAIAYRPTELIIETAAFQRALARDDRLEALSRKYGFRIREHETAGRKSDPVMGVAAMAGSFIQGEIDLAAGDERSRTRLDPLRVQLRAWRPTIPTKLLVQDAVMAVWFGWRWWKSQQAGLQTSTEEFNTAPLPWKPTGMPRWQSYIASLKTRKAA